MKCRWLIAALLLGCSTALSAQTDDRKVQGFVHGVSDGYDWPTDEAVLEKLDRWQDLKFGVFFHWGLYSIPGISESWPLCSEDRFIARRRKIRSDLNYEQFKTWYWGLKDSFDPQRFDPEAWAGVMEDAGMKYMVFTTKHHDGFCMFDSEQSDFSVAATPFGSDPRHDIAKHVFDSFRRRGFMIGAYFSKPDWHCPYYWHPDKATPSRHVNYDIEVHPDWWKRFKEYTAAQIDELMTRYGRIDILWLDGGWVSAPKEDIDMDRIVDDARVKQPGMLAVDRTIRGRNENYQTPELRIPETQLPHPWESCITLTNRWGWWPDAPYKSARTVIGVLAEVTAKGGSLLLGVGPTGQGEIEEQAIVRLREIGEWLRANGRAIYGTRITPNYRSGDVWFTADKDGKTLYALYALPDGAELPAEIEWTGNEPTGTMRLLRGNRRVNYTVRDGKVKVKLPAGVKNEPLAFAFRIAQ